MATTANHTTAESWPRRTMTGHVSSMAEGILHRVVTRCQLIDSTARLSSMTRDDEGSTFVTLRCGDTCSIHRLNEAAQRTMPFCRTRVVESVLDGFMEVCITIPSRGEERRLVRRYVTKRRVPAYLIVLAWILIVTATVDWVSTVRQNSALYAAGAAFKDEL